MEGEAIAKLNADITARKKNHADKMNQFDAIIMNAGKEGASLESASAAWEAYESMIEEVKKEEDATANEAN